jgi:outer membrane cobalamin receptor
MAFSEEPDEPQRSEDVVITVSAQELALSSVSASVTIISREMIEASKTENVLDLLQEVPFVHISQVGGAGGLATVTLRGGDPNFTLVMIDGIPVNDPTNVLGGSYDFSYLSTDQIDRIEIVRGPLSSIYGSEAISGVINIISRKGEGRPRLRLEGRTGNFGSQEARIGLEGSESIWSYGFSGSYYDVDEQTFNDTLNRKTFAGFSRFDFSNEKQISVTARYTAADTSGFPENGGGPLFSVLRDPKTADISEGLLGFRYQQKQFAMDADYSKHQNDTFTPAILDGIPPGFQSLPSFANETDFERTRIQGTLFWSRGNWSASGSASWKRESGDSVGLIAEMFPSEFQLQRDTASAGGEVLFDSKQLHASFGIRVDHPEDFSLETSPRLGIAYVLPNSTTRLRATWGEGFKLPSFFALGDPNIGNPDLLPERSRAWDAGVEQEWFDSKVVLSAAWFHNSFRDLIDFSPEVFRLVNRREVVTQGLELEGRWRPERAVQWVAYLTYIDAEIKDSTEPLRDRPEWRGGFGVDWQFLKKGKLHVRYTSVGERFDFQIPVPDRMVADSYQTLDLAASYEFLDNITGFVRIDNLFDSEYQEFIGFPNPGIYFRAGVNLTFDLQ